MTFDWHNEKRKIRDLVPYVANPRQITEKQAQDLKASLDKFGVADPIIINTDNTIIGGHQRKKILETLMGVDPDYEIDVRVPDRELSIDESRELNVRLNKNVAGWDFDTLANNFELDDLLDWGFEKSDLDIDLWMPEPEDDPGAQVDRAEELREIWGVETGQLWQLGEHRMICGDCTDMAVVDRVMGGERALVLTDAPYGVDIVQNNAVGGGNLLPVGHYAPIVGDDTTETAKLFYEVCLDYGFTDFILWGGNYFTDFLPPSPCWVIWDKRGDMRSNNFADCEMAWTSKNAPARIHKQVWMGMIKEGEHGKRQHPTQKPVDLMDYCIELFDAEIVFDGFLGSGTTLIACERLNRKCRAVEISPAYVAVAIQRWVDMTGGEPVLIREES